ncbi:hypothetical protein H2204_004750 [Knufia peltigerae]|uniref:BZIP domain-containing protein n=1 Tax=Knufia peltigerae TaxID=1002370 RepID=A0AA38Y6Y0_9EURO|nr:hypothetical protein H2204_004750 [Knufia peltigerae]
MASHPQMLSNMQQDSEMDPSWAGQDYGAVPVYNNGVVSEAKGPGYGGLLKGFGGMQKKLTRGMRRANWQSGSQKLNFSLDGQPAKRRGPKPDSKPAQTRRQELNRQAQRTHRERKENYIKALELELARLRETYLAEQNAREATLKQQQLVIENQRNENLALREILMNRGIQFENELENRKAVIAMRPKREENSLSPPNMAFSSPTSMPGRSVVGYGSAGQPTPTVYSLNMNSAMSTSGHSPGTTHHSHSPQGPEIQEVSIKQEPGAISDMPGMSGMLVPGIFEKDPQLGIDFILKLEQTCRDHGEYLVRRSMDSPNNDEEAVFSGHALMASCPPPSHIQRTPAVNGGLDPTYEHKVPDAESVQILNNLLNLSQSLKGSAIPSGQVTPIMALQSLKGHRNYATLTREDVLGMIDSIRSKVRCYGFGAVMEDFELRDALSSIFATKPETYDQLGTDYTAEIDEMYS